ncbi:MAG: hypothetical protein B7X37_01780 [Halothiobacillus sp. 14-55-98]|jgi:tetratricopeptide (TPR) repeat protein|nr:MAG: hypothetical protein B7X37_01780 [Halothiobacillus sp. 14-55-98]
MIPITPPAELPDSLKASFSLMNTTEPAREQLDSKSIKSVTDWFYSERWHQERADKAELMWLLHWLPAEQSERIAEIADAICISQLEAGDIDSAIALAEDTLAKYDDFCLRHTLALAQSAKGDLNQAIGTLEQALGNSELIESNTPAEQRIQAWLDLARLLQNAKALFKAMRPARAAIALAAQYHDEELLVEALTLLVRQLIEQGGSDEAWEALKPHLSDAYSTGQSALWTLAFSELSNELSEADRNRGSLFFLDANEPDALIRLWVKRGETAKEQDDVLIAYILCLLFRAPIDAAAPLAAKLLLRDKDRQTERAPLIAASAMALAEIPDDRSIKRAHWYRDAMIQLISVARHQGVPEAAVKQWAEDQKLLLEHGVIERASEQLINELATPPAWLQQAIRK